MARITDKIHKCLLVIVMGISLMSIAPRVCADNLHLVDNYSDTFVTDKVSYDSFEHSLMWLDKTFPVQVPHLILVEIEGDSGLQFLAYDGHPAELGYCLPIDPQVTVREASWIVEVDLEVRLSMNRDPANPVMGYLGYKISPDGVTWSDPTPLKHGRNQLSLGLLSEARYLMLLGSNAAITSLNIELFEPKATILVPDHVPDIQTAIDLASNGDRIRVAEGRYYGEGNTNLDFKGKSILLMGAGAPENCVLDGEGRRRGVRFQNGESAQTVIDGFTITNCTGDRGGGILCSNASPTVSNCIITACIAEGVLEPGRGGGMFVEAGRPVVKNCLFESNTAEGSGQGAQGGGIFVAGNGAIDVFDTTFSRNRANESDPESGGGAVYLATVLGGLTAPARFERCLFTSNVTHGQGAGLYLARAAVDVENCTVADNAAQSDGGGIFVHYTSASGQDVLIRNSILWSNLPQDLFKGSSAQGASVTVEYSNLGTHWPGTGNLSEDPLFADADGRDYHLVSYVGRYVSTNQWVHDTLSSPCIDAGDPASHTAAERSPDGNSINMGAYGGTAQASRGNGAMVLHVDIDGGHDGNLGLDRDQAFASIGRAVELARDGDYVLVWPGQYHEEISYAGKAITIQSAADAATVSAPSGYAFSFNQGEGSNSVLRNLILADCHTGAVFCEVSSPTLENLTIVNNRIGVNAEENANPSIRNCVFWRNQTGDVFGCIANYSRLVSSEGTGNISRDPLFADLKNGDYHLRSKYGRYWPDHDVWIVDETTSPCLDGGEPGVYPFEEPLHNGGVLNQGAYAGTGYASMSPPHNPADINADGMVDFRDFAEFAESWLLP